MSFDASLRRVSGGGAWDTRQFIRFAIVGVIQNAINVGTFALAVSGGVPFLLAAVLAAVIALSVSFALNRSFTFGGTSDRTAARAMRFALIWITILLVGLGLLAILVETLHVPRVLAQTIVIVVGAPISYLSQRRFTFAASGTAGEPVGDAVGVEPG